MDPTAARVDPYPDPLGKGSKGWTPPWQGWTPTRTPWGRGPRDGPTLSFPPTNTPTGANSEASFPGGLPHPFQNCAGGLPRSSPGLGGPVTALAFFDGWVIPTVKKGHAFRLGQGMGPTVAGVAPIRPPWGEGLGRPSPVLEGVWQVCHRGLPESVAEVPGPVVILVQSIHFGMGRGWGGGGTIVTV